MESFFIYTYTHFLPFFSHSFFPAIFPQSHQPNPWNRRVWSTDYARPGIAASSANVEVIYQCLPCMDMHDQVALERPADYRLASITCIIVVVITTWSTLVYYHPLVTAHSPHPQKTESVNPNLRIVSWQDPSFPKVWLASLIFPFFTFIPFSYFLLMHVYSKNHKV